jgi:hypothetical protein
MLNSGVSTHSSSPDNSAGKAALTSEQHSDIQVNLRTFQKQLEAMQIALQSMQSQMRECL